jgi:hypothetical protein
MLSDLFLFLFTFQCLLVGLMMLAGPPHCVQVPTLNVSLSQLQVSTTLETGSTKLEEHSEVEFNCELSCCAEVTTNVHTNATMSSEAVQALASCEAASS